MSAHKTRMVLKRSLSEESKDNVLIDDSLLLKALHADLDIFDIFSDYAGQPIGLATYLVPGLPDQNIPFQTICGVPKAKWDQFKEFIDKALITYDDKKYGPILFSAKIPDIFQRGNKYHVHELVPIAVLSVINYTDNKILKPSKSMQERPDVSIDWVWKNHKPDIKQSRRRSPVGKNQRFAIYQRDEFRCHYCKRHKNELPNGVHLEIDHKIAYSDGGDDSFQNLVTACSDCNRGKSNKVVKDI